MSALLSWAKGDSGELSGSIVQHVDDPVPATDRDGSGGLYFLLERHLIMKGHAVLPTWVQYMSEDGSQECLDPRAKPSPARYLALVARCKALAYRPLEYMLDVKETASSRLMLQHRM